MAASSRLWSPGVWSKAPTSCFRVLDSIRRWHRRPREGLGDCRSADASLAGLFSCGRGRRRDVDLLWSRCPLHPPVSHRSQDRRRLAMGAAQIQTGFGLALRNLALSSATLTALRSGRSDICQSAVASVLAARNASEEQLEPSSRPIGLALIGSVPRVSKTSAQSKPGLAPSRSRYPAISLQSAEVPSHPKETRNQWLTKTALNPRSAEVWRQTGGERDFRASASASKCGGLCVKPTVMGDFSAAKSSGEFCCRKYWRRERNWDPTFS
jgi:hypothetical protein